MSLSDLGEEDRQRGFALATDLLDSGFPIGFCGWIRTDEGDFRLYIATPLYTRRGPLETARLVTRFLAVKGGDYGFDFTSVMVGPAEARLMSALREGFGLVRGGPHRFSMENSSVNGVLVPDFLLYVANPQDEDEDLDAARGVFEGCLERIEAAA